MPHRYNRFFHYFLNRELSELYFTVAIRSFALSLITIFVPIYLFEKGFSINEIFLFYSIFSASAAIMVYFSSKLSARIGIKHGILSSIPLLITFYIIIKFVEAKPIFFIAPILLGIQASLFWVNFHTDFAEFSSRRFRAEQISGYIIICLILTALGPLVGGFFIHYVGFNLLFILVALLLLTSVIPLFLSKEIYVRKDFSLRKVKESLKEIKPLGLTGFIGYGFVLSASVAWPLFMFLVLKAHTSTGSLVSLSLFVSILSNFFIGKLGDKLSRKNILMVGSFLYSLVWLLAFFSKSIFSIVLVNVLLGFIGPSSVGGPVFDALSYDMTKRKNVAEIIAIRELTIRLSMAFSFFLLSFFASLKLAFIVGSVGCVLAVIFSKKFKGNF